MRFDILTIFPKIIDSYVTEGVIGRARSLKHAIEVYTHNIRDYSNPPHYKVDDSPFGGGPGMILQIEPIYRVLEHIVSSTPNTKKHIIFFKAGGTIFNQKKVLEYAHNYDHLIMICGRYEGIDSRVEEFLSHESISIGEFVLTGGELAALSVLDAVSRYIPHVLGNVESTKEESWSQEDFLEYPQYSRPQHFTPPNPCIVKESPLSWDVPDILTSGNHQAIQRWRHEHVSHKPKSS